MTFLKKLGAVIVAGLNEAAKIVGVIQPVMQVLDPSAASKVSAVSSELTKIFAVVQNTEAAAAALAANGLSISGTQKLIMAAPFVNQEILLVMKALNLSVADQAKYQSAVNAFTSAAADILNAAHGDIPQTNMS